MKGLFLIPLQIIAAWFAWQIMQGLFPEMATLALLAILVILFTFIDYVILALTGVKINQDKETPNER